MEQNTPQVQRVVVTKIDLTLENCVRLMVTIAIATIPAGIIIGLMAIPIAFMLAVLAKV
ncbi:MAG: hypothetical protein R3E66_23505 [bacterium]